MKLNDEELKRREEEVKQYLESCNYTIVGTFQKEKNFGFVLPDNKKLKFDVFVETKNSHRAKNNDKVVVRITKLSKKKNKNPEGIILEVLGNKNDPNVEVISILKNFQIPYEFDTEVLKEAKNLNTDITTNCNHRKNLTNLFTVTIDSEDAKDLDDAISIEGNKIYVHIADVSNYVKEKSAIDKEALNRGTSVYLLDRVVPMLPRELSNGICSLNANEDRYTLTVEMDIDSKGKVTNYAIYESIINVDMRMSYNGVHACLNNLELNNGEDINEYNKHKDFLVNAYKLSNILREKRRKRGAIDFDLKETCIALNDDFEPIGVYAHERFESHKIIEDFMLCANETVAEAFNIKEIPFLYRVHEDPKEEKIENLKYYTNKLGYDLQIKNDKIYPKDIQKLLDSVQGKKEEAVIEKLTLRSMQQARYTNENLGHFALAATYYCHFTSPIRRYPDLQIHRIIKEVLHNEFSQKRLSHYNKILHNVGTKISICERRAIDAERDLERLKECEYMHNYLGDVYEGNISGLTNFGIYVELDNTIEGMIPLRDLKDDFYIFDETKLEIYGERKHKKFSMGDRLTVKIIASSKENRTIDFELIQ